MCVQEHHVGDEYGNTDLYCRSKIGKEEACVFAMNVAMAEPTVVLWIALPHRALFYGALLLGPAAAT